MATLVCSLVGIFAMLAVAWSSFVQPHVPELVVIVLFGLLGGTISAMLRATDLGTSARIPELTSTIRVTFMRVLMGGASALILQVLFSSDLGGALSARLLEKSVAQSFQDLRGSTAYAVAFVAGFSERFVTRAVEKIAGSADDKGTAKSA